MIVSQGLSLIAAYVITNRKRRIKWVKRRAVSGILATLLLIGLLNIRWITTSMADTVIGVIDNLQLEMTIENTTLTLGEDVFIKLTLRNVGDNNIIIGFATSQAFDTYYFIDDVRWNWSDDQIVLLEPWSILLEPTETYTETLQWDLHHYNGTSGEYVSPRVGTYYLWGECVGVPAVETFSPIAVGLLSPLLGDVNGDDKVDGKDIAVVAQAFGSYPTHPRWNPITDLNRDRMIDGKDIVKVAKNFGKTYP